MITAKEIANQLAQRAEDIAQHLLPNGKRDGNEWHVGSIHGESGQSLKVHLVGDKSGLWCDFANPDQSGDLIDLWAATRQITLAEAIKQSSQYLGVYRPHFEAHKPKKFSRPSVHHKALHATSAVMDYLVKERKLSPDTINKFQIGERNRGIIFPFIRDNETILVKYMGIERDTHGKKKIDVEKNCEPCLFGWQTIPPNVRKILITEGEIDAMTMYQYGVPALSVPFGGGNGKKQSWVEYEFDRLTMFDEIYLCFDPDPAGNEAVAELMERLGRHRCRVVRLPHKDPNACLQAGVTKEEIQQCINEAASLDPEELKSASSFVDDVIDQFYPKNGKELGIAPPWDKVKGKIIFRPDELSVWTGINGHGKSQLLGHLILHFMKNNARVCIASLELKPKRLLYRLTRQAAGLAEPTGEYIHEIHDWYGEQLWLFDLVGTAKTKRLLEVFLYARQRYGIDIFVIDSFMKLDIAEDDYKAQKLFLEQLCDFKNQHNCQIHIVVHPRKAMDESHPPGKLDNKGTGAITDLADNCFAVWRNKQKELIKKLQTDGVQLDKKQLENLTAPDCLWICDKQRNGEWEGRISLWFDPASFQYLSYEKQKPTQYVSYSSCTQGASHA